MDTIIMKKRSEATQTLRAGCREAEPTIFAPPQTPFPGAQDGRTLISWRWLGDRKGIRPVKTGCWFVGGDDLTGALHDL